MEVMTHTLNIIKRPAEELSEGIVLSDAVKRLQYRCLKCSGFDLWVDMNECSIEGGYSIFHNFEIFLSWFVCVVHVDCLLFVVCHPVHLSACWSYIFSNFYNKQFVLKQLNQFTMN